MATKAQTTPPGPRLEASQRRLGQQEHSGRRQQEAHHLGPCNTLTQEGDGQNGRNDEVQAVDWRVHAHLATRGLEASEERIARDEGQRACH